MTGRVRLLERGLEFGDVGDDGDDAAIHHRPLAQPMVPARLKVHGDILGQSARRRLGQRNPMIRISLNRRVNWSIRVRLNDRGIRCVGLDEIDDLGQ